MDTAHGVETHEKDHAGYAETAARIWREAADEACKETMDRERRAARNRKLPFGLTDDH